MRFVIVDIAVFLILKLIWLVSPGSQSVEYLLGLLTLPAKPEDALAAPWTIITYMFIHIDFWHLLINCLWLAWFSALLEEIAGRKWVTAGFLLGGIAGAICFISFSTLFAPESTSLLLGSSAAVFAVIAATLISAPQKRTRLALIGTFSLRWIAAIGLILFFLASIEMDSMQTAAHIGGITVGIILSMTWRVHTHRHMQAMKSLTKSRIDQINLIRKVNQTGYSSLSHEEKLRLFNLSAKRPNGIKTSENR